MVMTPARPTLAAGTPPKRGNHWLLPLGALAVVSIVLVSAYLFFRAAASKHQDPTGIPVATAEPIRQRAVPQETLTAAADALAAQPLAPQNGRYEYVSIEQWARDGDGISPRRIQKWRAADGSGREDIAVLPTLETAAFNRPMVGTTDFGHASLSSQTYAAQGIPAYIAEPSPNPVILLQQLHTIEPETLGAAGILRAIASFHLDTCPETAVRVALLRILASVDGLAINDHAVDELGRPGLEITFSTPSSSDTLQIDPQTGLLQSLRQSYTVAPRPPAIHQHVIYQRCGRTDVIGPTAP